LRSAVQAAQKALDEIREGEVRWSGAIEENICALSVAVARQLIGRELETRPETVVTLVRRALAEFPVDQPVRIRVNPADLAAIESGEPDGDATRNITRDREARWLADNRIAAGGCVVEGRERIVDGRVDRARARVPQTHVYPCLKRSSSGFATCRVSPPTAGSRGSSGW
jgi:flagellar assembly protein FliH